MTPILTRPKPAPPRSQGNFVAVAVAVIAAISGFALLLLIMPALRLPASVDMVTISNPHPWDVEVELGRPDGSRWIGLGRVGRESTSTFQSVIDPGDQWVLRFSYGGIHQGEVAVRRAEVKQAGWKLTIPDEFAERMRGAGETPTAD
jgi:hypothetical protein